MSFEPYTRQRIGGNFGSFTPGAQSLGAPGPFQGMSGSPFAQNPVGVAANGVNTPGGMDKVTMAMLLMNALGTGFSAYSQAQQQKKDREFSQRKYDEGADVRAEGRRRLMAPPGEFEIENNDFFNNGQAPQTMQGNVAAPPPVGPTADRDEELRRILRARLGGQY